MRPRKQAACEETLEAGARTREKRGVESGRVNLNLQKE